MALRYSVRAEGLREVLRALRQVPAEGQRALVARSNALAYNLQRRIKRAAAQDSRQAERASSTVTVVRGQAFPTVQAGPHELLFGSEFGVTRHFGWFNRARYYDNDQIQFRHPHRGAASNWFFTTQDEARPFIEQEWTRAADDVIRGWSA